MSIEFGAGSIATCLIDTSENRPPPIEYDDYGDYLQSLEWKWKAWVVKAKAGFRCQVCNSRGILNAHHRTYDRKYHEDYDDLIALCSDCHEKFHNVRRKEDWEL